MNVSKLMRSLAAKTNPNDSAQWLPLCYGCPGIAV